jgi:hypothetical protein
MDKTKGETRISNRETAAEEDRERREHPSGAPESDRAGRAGQQPSEEARETQTSRKSGIRSDAQKQSGSKYVDRPAPPSRKVSGAHGKEH